jgi:hypothetical protein
LRAKQLDFLSFNQSQALAGISMQAYVAVTHDTLTGFDSDTFTLNLRSTTYGTDEDFLNTHGVTTSNNDQRPL